MAAYYGHFNNLEVDNLVMSGGMISGFVRSDISGKLYCSGGLANRDMTAIRRIGSGADTALIASNSVGFGSNVLANETLSGGGINVAIGNNALATIQQGTSNVAIGNSSLYNLINAFSNVSVGVLAGTSLSGGGSNTFVGYAACRNSTNGSNNICVGQFAGSAYTGSESNNIIIGLSGVSGESGVCRIGLSGTITDTYIAGNLYTKTQTAGDNSTKAATTAYVNNLIPVGVSLSGAVNINSNVGGSWSATCTSTGYYQTLGGLTILNAYVAWSAKLGGGSGNLWLSFPFTFNTSKGIMIAPITINGATGPANTTTMVGFQNSSNGLVFMNWQRNNGSGLLNVDYADLAASGYLCIQMIFNI